MRLTESFMLCSHGWMCDFKCFFPEFVRTIDDAIDGFIVITAYCDRCDKWHDLDPVTLREKVGGDYSPINRRTRCRITPGCEEAGKGFDSLDPAFRRAFERNGIGAKEWDVIRAPPLEDDRGIGWIKPQNVSDAALGDRLLEMILTETDYAVRFLISRNGRFSVRSRRAARCRVSWSARRCFSKASVSR